MIKKKLKTITIFTALGFFVLLGSELTFAFSTVPTVDGTIHDGGSWSKDNNPDHISAGTIVQVVDGPTFEDRGVIEFNISSLAFQTISDARLELNVFNSSGPYPFTIDVFTYAGDGFLSLNDWTAGSLFTSFAYSGEGQFVLDVSPVLASLAGVGENFIGFNFQFANPSDIELNGPFVAFNSLEHQYGDYLSPCRLIANPVPEPATIILYSFGLFGLGSLKKRKQSV